MEKWEEGPYDNPNFGNGGSNNPNSDVGADVAINDQGDVIAIGAPQTDSAHHHRGFVNVKKIINGNWEFITDRDQTLGYTYFGATFNADGSSNNNGSHKETGYSVDLNAEGNILVIGHPKDGNATNGGNLGRGFVSVWLITKDQSKTTGNTWRNMDSCSQYKITYK